MISLREKAKSLLLNNKTQTPESTILIEKTKEYGGSVITFMIMHFLYFPFLTWCLLINYMIRNSFFNYDIISDNFFAVSITTAFLMIMISLLSLVMWGSVGYIILCKKRKIKKEKIVFTSLLIINLIVFLLMLTKLYQVNWDDSQIIVTIVISLLLVIFYGFYFSSKLRARLLMIGILSGISSFSLFIYGDYSSTFFGKALNVFGLGGNRNITVIFNDKSYELHKGKLLLLTPDFVYFIENQKTIIVPMKSIKNLDISHNINNYNMKK